MRICKKCNQSLSLELFSANRKGWRCWTCKKCRNKNRLEWRHKNLERDKANVRRSAQKRRFGRSREEVLRHFQHTCQSCGLVTSIELKLHIHHKDNKGRTCKAPNNNGNNLTILCDSCHHSLHAKQIRRDKYGKFTDGKE